VSAFNHAVAAAAEMLAKLSHLDRMPGGRDALTGLSVEIDGVGEAVRITWVKPDAARKAAEYKDELRDSMKAAAKSAAPSESERKAAIDSRAAAALPGQAELARVYASTAMGLAALAGEPAHSSPPVAAPPPCERSVASGPPPSSHETAAGDAPRDAAVRASVEIIAVADEPAPEPSGEDLSRVPPEAPAPSPVEPPANSNRGRVLAAWRDGGRDVLALSRASGLDRDAVVQALKGLRSVGLIPKASELRSPDRPGCAMLEGELAGDAALRLREAGFGWEAIAQACGYTSADSAQMSVSRWRAKHRPVSPEPPPAATDGPDLRTAKVDAVLTRIGIGAEQQDEVLKDAGAVAPQACVEAATPSAASMPSTETQAEDVWDDSILVTVQERDDGRLDVAGPAGVHMASPAVGRIIARLAGGALLGAEALAPVAGVKPAELPSLQSAVRLVCNRVGRSLLIVKGIGWRIVR
jgi:hypothetical protein